MSKPVIKVENLSKKYVIAHQTSGRGGQGTLRDAITDGVKSVSKRFTKQSVLTDPTHEDFWVLNDVSFDINQGDRVGIIGRNGAGKSTLLKILSRITEPTRGSITIEGRVASLLEVGTGFHAELTGRENIFLNGAILGMGKEEIKRKFDEIVAFSEVEKFLDTPVKRYSSGMYVRLAFAVAAHLEPEILIVDEVLAVGDIQFQKKCLGKMQELSKEDARTVLFVSHNMDALSSLCSNVVFLEKGKATGPMPTDIGITKYLQSFSDQTKLSIATRPRWQHKTRPPIIVGFEIENQSGASNVLSVGSPVTFTVTLKDFTDVKDLQCAIVITTERGQRVITFHTFYQSALLVQGSIQQTLVCEVPSLPLVPSQYLFEIVVADGFEILEKMEAVAQLEVAFADIFGTGRIPNAHQGMVAIPCNWRIK
jgi:lipopolysaccharide transport system ATP-binding protein